MRNKEPILRFHRKPGPVSQKNQLLVKDLIQYLLGLAELNGEEKTGNTELARALRILANDHLCKYADYPVSELTNAVEKTESTDNLGAASSKAKSALPPELESISQEEIERILADESFTKLQVVELGVRRFGISRSKLARLRKEDALESVRAALGHEKSLDVIAKEARKAGNAVST